MDNIETLRHFISYSVYEPRRTRLSIDRHHEWVNHMLNSHMTRISQELAHLAIEDSPGLVKMMKKYILEITQVMETVKQTHKNMPVENTNPGMLDILEHITGLMRQGIREIAHCGIAAGITRSVN